MIKLLSKIIKNTLLLMILLYSQFSFSSNSEERVVSIGGALTEIIWALGADANVVGVDTTSMFPEAVSKLPNVGYARSLSPEGILSLTPTQVIAIDEAGPPLVIKQIEQSGIKVSVIPTEYSFDGILKRIDLVGNLLNKKGRASELSNSLTKNWEDTQKNKLKKFNSQPKVLFILSQSPNHVMVSGSNTSADAMIKYAGAINAIEEFSGFKPINPEAVIKANPDIILLSEQGMKSLGGIENALSLPGIKQTKAGVARLVITQEMMFLLGFGPRFPLSVETLNANIYSALEN